MIKQLIRKIVPPETVERFFIPYSMFFRNTKARYYKRHGVHNQLVSPITCCPEFVELEDYVRLQSGTRIISSGAIVRIKRFSAIGADCTFVPGSHVPTVGLPQYLSITHVNDTAGTLVVEEDVWIGTRCILLSKAHIGRGAVVGAGSLVNKVVPPYAVVAGSPAKVIAVRFSLEQIMRHEAILYPPEERLSREYLEELFRTEYAGKHVIGTSEISEEDMEKLRQAKERYGIRDYAEHK